MIKRYSVGFLFSHDLRSVAMIEKARPEWQRGKLNGIGGHIEDGENSFEAMCREFHEETGIVFTDWTLGIKLEHERYALHIFKGVLPVMDRLPDLKNGDPTEPVGWQPVELLHNANTIPNLKWVIPLLLDKTVGFPIRIQDTGH